MRYMRQLLMLLVAVFTILIGTVTTTDAAEKSHTVTANLFVPGHLNKQLPGITAYLTNGNNPLGIGGYPAIAPTQPVSDNATLTIDKSGRKIVVVDILNPVFTLQQIESGSNVKILDIVKDNEIYTANKNTIKGRITQLTVELLDNSGTYTFTNCREYPTLLGMYWDVPLTLSVDLTNVSLEEPKQEEEKPSATEPIETKTEEVTLANGTVVNSVTKQDGSKSVTMTTVNGSTSITSISAKKEAMSTITLAKVDAFQGVELPIQAIEVGKATKAHALQFVALGEENALQVAVPVKNMSSAIVVEAQQANGETTLMAPTYKNGHVVFTAQKNVTYKLVNNSKTFKDVKTSAWFNEPVQYMAAREWLSGTNNTFKPNEAITRAMVVTVLYRMANEPKAVKTHSFQDVLANRSYTDAVAWAYAQGYIKGYDDTTFGVSKPITREHFAVILWRYAGSPKVDGTLATFKDAKKVGASSKDALIWAVQNSILSGKEDGTLNPKGNTTRAHAAKMMMTFMEGVQTK